MIISASRRTDIPAYYSDWFLSRIKEKYVLVRNPMNFRQVSRVPLSPDVVDGIVFWTKNPAPMLERLDALSDYMFYFQVTLTPYGRDIEPGISSKDDKIIPAFQRLADTVGPERVVWRYDPIFLTDVYTEAYHIEQFDKIAGRLRGYANKCTFSFLDMYKKIETRMKPLNTAPLSEEQMHGMAKAFAVIAGQNGLTLDTCAERIDLAQYGIGHARCVDGRLLGRLLGCRLNVEKDGNQRPECGCDASIDIGMYDTCPAGCKYCYANRSHAAATDNRSKHESSSPLLTGTLSDQDMVKEREAGSCKDGQLQLFDPIPHNDKTGR
jgi:hypothetical protein